MMGSWMNIHNHLLPRGQARQLNAVWVEASTGAPSCTESLDTVHTLLENLQDGAHSRTACNLPLRHRHMWAWIESKAASRPHDRNAAFAP